MCAHGAAVVRGSWHALVTVDMPFGSYEESPAQAFRNAARVLKETGAAAVKLEGGEAMAETVAFLVRRSIPVIGHVGLAYQAVNALGGYRARPRRGRGGQDPRRRARRRRRRLLRAGARGRWWKSPSRATRSVACPTIGIGASAQCDGQILVTEDFMMGMFERTPRFVKRFGDLASEIGAAAEAYAADVRSRAFPTPDQTYHAKK